MTRHFRRHGAQAVASSALFALVLISTRLAEATTFISGELPAVVTAANSPYIALATLTVTGHSCLIESGVEINFTADTGIELRLLGNPTTLEIGNDPGTPVLLRGWNGSQWFGIRRTTFFQDISSTLNANGMRMEGAAEGIALSQPFFGAHTVEIKNSAIDGMGATKGIEIFAESPSYSASIVIENVEISGVTSGNGLHVTCDEPSSVRSCTVTGSVQGISCQGTFTVEDLIASGNTTGISLWGSITASRLTATNNETGIVLGGVTSGPTLTESYAMDNLIQGIFVLGNVGQSTAPLIEHSQIIGNGQRGINMVVPAIVHQCLIHDNGQYDVYVESPVVPYTTLNMRNNYWGPATTAEMQAEGTFSNIEKIFDWWDSSQFSLVDYEGFIVPTSAPGDEVKPSSWGAIKASYR